MNEKIKALRELLKNERAHQSDEEILHWLLDEALENARADAEARAFHLTFREPAPSIKHLSLVTD
jgi:hypothetical protein